MTNNGWHCHNCFSQTKVWLWKQEYTHNMQPITILPKTKLNFSEAQPHFVIMLTVLEILCIQRCIVVAHCRTKRINFCIWWWAKTLQVPLLLFGVLLRTVATLTKYVLLHAVCVQLRLTTLL